MPASPIDRIAALLSSSEPGKRIAAAIVLGELKAKQPKVVAGLAGCLTDGGPQLQRAALEALRAVGAKPALAKILPLLAVRDEGVRAAAIDAVASIGESVVAQVQARQAAAGPEERLAIDAVLARLGGKTAFSALLGGLAVADEKEAGAAAVAMRQQVKDADAASRRSYLGELERLLKQSEKKGAESAAAVRAALKMLGYLEDARAVPTLLRWATAKKQPAPVRQEALIALRFTTKGKPDVKLVNALLAAAEDTDRTLAQTALMTLAGIDLPEKTAGRLDPLIGHPDIERAGFIIHMLSHRKSDTATALLVQVITSHEPRRARLAADALKGRTDAAALLADALVKTDDVERAKLLAQVLRPMAGELTNAQKRRLLDGTLERLAEGTRAAEAALDVLRDADADRTAVALRELASKLGKRQPERATVVLRLLCRSPQATHDDDFQLASRLLQKSHKDTSPAARRGDESLAILERLLRGGYDVAAALKRDKSADLEALYYAGFHLIEQQHPAGEELLRQVMERGGRKKIATMARNKLELSGRAA
jgi:HEAT repeat protein